MKFGYFDDQNKEYVITTPQTPLPWINYLGSEDFFSLVSNTAGGYSFYRDARMRRLTRYRYNNSPLDMTATGSTSRMAKPYGTRAGSPPRPRWTVTAAATVWATPFWRAKRTV